MVIVKQLAAEFKIELVVKHGDAFPDFLRLHAEVFLVVKSCSHNDSPDLCEVCTVLSCNVFSIRHFSPYGYWFLQKKGVKCGTLKIVPY